jgi:hypothetical protein
VPNEIGIKVTGDLASLRVVPRDAAQAGRDAGRALADGLNKGARDAEAAVTRASKGAAKATEQVGEAGKKAGKKLGDGVTDGAQQADEALDKTKRKAAETGEAVAEAGEQAKKGWVERAGEMQSAVVEGLDGITDKVGPIGMAAGGLLGAALVMSVMTAIERARIDAKLQASMDPSVAGKAGEAAGALYGRGFGASLEEVADAMTSIFQQGLVGATTAAADIEEIGRQAIVTAEVTGERVHDIGVAVSQMLRTGMVQSAREGFDLIVRAQQMGLNKSEDLIDTMEEYGTQFRKVGLDGQHALGLISQGMQGGARDADTVADAIKEFTLIAVDGSAETAAAFEALGINAQAATAAIAQGGKPASAALNDVLIKLRQIKDPVERARLAVALFGTKAEDLGDALFDMDLSSATADFQDFEKAAQEAADMMEKTPGAKFSAMWRDIEENMAHAGDWFAGLTDLPEEMQAQIKELQRTKAAQDAQKNASEEQAQASQKAAASFGNQTEALGRLIDKNHEYYGIKRGVIESELRYQEAIDAGTEALKANGNTLDKGTEKGRANWSALLDLAESTEQLTKSMHDNGASTEQMNAAHDRGRAALIALADKMGYSKSQAVALTNQLLGMSKPYNASFNVNTGQAYNALYGLDRYMTAMTRPRSVSINVNYRTGATPAAFAHGGTVGAGFLGAQGVPHRAEGGPSGGPTAVHERGFELIDLAPGSRVNSHEDSDRMLMRAAKAGAAIAGGGVGSGSVAELRLAGNVDSVMGAALQALIRKGALKLVVGRDGRRVEVA